MADGWGQYEDIEVETERAKTAAASGAGGTDGTSTGLGSAVGQAQSKPPSISPEVLTSIASGTASIAMAKVAGDKDNVAGGSAAVAVDAAAAAEALGPSQLDLYSSGCADLRLMRNNKLKQQQQEKSQAAAPNKKSDFFSTAVAMVPKGGIATPARVSSATTASSSMLNKIGSTSPASSANSVEGVRSVPSCPNFGSLEAAHQRIFDSGLTFSEAKGKIWELRESGSLMKRGFRYRKLWVKRYVELSGRMLKYYEKKPKDVKAAANPRGTLELTQYTAVVALPDSPSLRFAFNVIPDGNHPKYSAHPDKNNFLVGSPSQPRQQRAMTVIGGRVFREPVCDGNISVSRTAHSDSGGGGGFFSWFSSASSFSSNSQTVSQEMDKNGNPVSYTADDSKVWRLMARSEKERKLWIHTLEKAINLIRRVEVAPTLCGVGSVHYHYRLEEKIGTGWFGDVYSAVATMTGKQYVIKVVDKAKHVKTKENATVLRTEIKVMRRVTRELDHANICKLFQAYEDTNTVYLVMEHLSGGNLLEHIAECVDELTEAFVANVVRQVAGALKELHGAGIVLCDLKPENLLYTDVHSNIVKVVEFGRAIICPPASSVTSAHYKVSGGHSIDMGGPATYTPGGVNRRGPLVGTPGFIAPEVISFRDYSPACDVWALGCILFMLLVGYSPFTGGTAAEVLQTSTQGLQADKLNKEDWKHISSNARLMIGRMLCTNQTRRLDAHAVLADKWVNAPPEGLTLDKPLERIKRHHQMRTSQRAFNNGNSKQRFAYTVSNTTTGRASGLYNGATLAQRRANTPPDSYKPNATNVVKALSTDEADAATNGTLQQNNIGRISRKGSAMRLSTNWSTSAFLGEGSGCGEDTANHHQQQQQADENGLRPSVSTFFELLTDDGGNNDRCAELLALDVRAEKIRAQFDGVDGSAADEDSQANFAPAGRFLNDLENQMRKVRENEQHRLELEANGEASHAITEQQAAQIFQSPTALSPMSTASNLITPGPTANASVSASVSMDSSCSSSGECPNRRATQHATTTDRNFPDSNERNNEDLEIEEEEEKAGSFVGKLSSSFARSGSLVARGVNSCAIDAIRP